MQGHRTKHLLKAADYFKSDSFYSSNSISLILQFGEIGSEMLK